MNTLTEQQQEEIGKKIAEILMLKKSKGYKDRYDTTWGNKTALGIFRTIQRINDCIDKKVPFYV